jgi:uncharacterized protein (TIGR02268 family)
MEAIPMVGPARALMLVLMAGSALAQPTAERVRREQRFTLTDNPADPIPEIHAAPEVATLVLFDAEIQPAAVQVDRARLKLLGSGPRFLLVQPVVALGPQERLILRVPYGEGPSPGSAVLALVAHPTEVDTRVEVTRRSRAGSACEAKLAEAQSRCAALSPTRFVRDGGIGKAGVLAKRVTAVGAPSQELSVEEAYVYTAEAWTLVRLKLRNRGPAPWRPQSATLVEARAQAPVRVRSVETEASEIAPGTKGAVFIECDALPEQQGTFTLEVRDTTGRTWTLPSIQLQKP